jgi:hypothetical protein
MGCGCKQKTNTPKPVIQKQGAINVVISIPLPYTREELQRCNDYFISRSKTADETIWVIDFHNSHFGEQLPHNYQGDGWIRLKNRIQHLNNMLNEYENSQNKEK